MRAYELMIIVDGGLEETDAQAVVRGVTAQITAKGGQIQGNPDWWGRRRFAYEIDKKTEGYYAVMNLVAEGGALDDVERAMRLADEIVRHKLLRLPLHEAARRGLTEAGATA